MESKTASAPASVELLGAEAARAHGERLDPGARGGLDVPRRVADEERVAAARLVEGGLDEVGRGLGLLHVARVRPLVDELAGAEQREVVLDLLLLGARRHDDVWPCCLRARTRSREPSRGWTSWIISK
jgi:hypothetical protein